MDIPRKAILSFLGRPVHVVVDRPMGCLHKDILYTLNYGFLPGVPGGDGEDQDAYILGVDEPVKTFDGIVIGIIHRHNDCEDKLVVGPRGMRFHQGQIREAVHFQEQFFDTSVTCLLRRSCGVIPFRQDQRGAEYLILLQTNGFWSFPKGHIEPFETEEEAALRELREETGLSGQLLPGIRVETSYPLSHGAAKELILFAGQVTGALHLQSSEARSYRWVTSAQLPQFLQKDTCAAAMPVLLRIDGLCKETQKNT